MCSNVPTYQRGTNQNLCGADFIVCSTFNKPYDCNDMCRCQYLPRVQTQRAPRYVHRPRQWLCTAHVTKPTFRQGGNLTTRAVALFWTMLGCTFSTPPTTEYPVLCSSNRTISATCALPTGIQDKTRAIYRCGGTHACHCCSAHAPHRRLALSIHCDTMKL